MEQHPSWSVIRFDVMPLADLLGADTFRESGRLRLEPAGLITTITPSVRLEWFESQFNWSLSDTFQRRHLALRLRSQRCKSQS